MVPYIALAAAPSPPLTALTPSAYSARSWTRYPQSRIGSPETEFPSMSVMSEQETPRLPVRSALFKQRAGGLVARWTLKFEHLDFA
jgi:hypothetical protein